MTDILELIDNAMESSTSTDAMRWTPDRDPAPDPDEPWDAGDGTCWLYFPQYDEWHGWEIHDRDGLYIHTAEEHSKYYPEAPAPPAR